MFHTHQDLGWTCGITVGWPAESYMHERLEHCPSKDSLGILRKEKFNPWESECRANGEGGYGLWGSEASFAACKL